MARVERIIDDWTGKELGDGEGLTVVFSLQEAYYQMDLSEDSFAKLEKLLQPWVDKAVEVDAPQAEPEPPRRGRRSGGQPARTDKEQLQAMREWLRGEGHDVSDRGRIAGHLQELYHAAH